MKFKISLSTIASFTTEVEADDEEQAIDKAYDQAKDASATWFPLPAGSLDLNDEWQYEEPHVEQVQA